MFQLVSHSQRIQSYSPTVKSLVILNKHKVKFPFSFQSIDFSPLHIKEALSSQTRSSASSSAVPHNGTCVCSPVDPAHGYERLTQTFTAFPLFYIADQFSARFSRTRNLKITSPLVHSIIHLFISLEGIGAHSLLYLTGSFNFNI